MRRDREPRSLDSLYSPREIALTDETWVAAAVIAGWRVAVNDPIRSADRDRGAAKNMLNDLQGLLGELVGAATVEAIPGVLSVQHDLLDVDGPVDDVDLVAEDEQGIVRLETKCHLDEANKRLFLINMRAHERSTLRRADGYLPIVSKLGAAVALVGRVIGIEAVASWDLEPYSDPARKISLSYFSPAYLGRSWPEVHARLVAAPIVVTRDRLEEAFEVARSSFAREDVESLELRGLTTAQVVERAATHR